MKNLLIVESPAKAKTIAKYLGGDFEVKSSVGHIREIPPKGKDAVDIAGGFMAKYQVSPEKKKIVSELKSAAKGREVWLATDPDREGEAIAWHLQQVLKLPSDAKRVTYQEITKSAVAEAVANPRTIDMDLVEAQQARQVLDRIVGYELSPVVWRKVPGGKSAGRVQSPALRLLAEREAEIAAFDSKFVFRVAGQFLAGKDEIKAELDHEFSDEPTVTSWLNSITKSKYTISDISTTPGSRNPSAPFTTSSLQQEANKRFGYSAKTTMAAAQKLYQAGKITYMRTDSVNLSNQALGAIGGFIEKEFGKNYLHIRKYQTKSANAQEAHEAIRPTNIALERASTNEYDQKLYDLIRSRTLASQMAPAELEKTTVTIDITGVPEKFVAKGEVVLFDGFLRVAGLPRDTALPKLNAGDELSATEITARQKFDLPPARYTEGSLVKKLESLGIGRPSTYATIIEGIQNRGYAVKGAGEGTEREAIELKLLQGQPLQREVLTEKTGADKGKLVPTDVGKALAGFLTEYFGEVVDYGFTAEIEQELDEIAIGQLERVKMLTDFYGPFHKLVLSGKDIDRAAVTNERELGQHPKTGLPIFAKLGRFGPMFQMGATASDDRPQYASIPKNLSVDTVTLDDALKAFELPRSVGQTEDGQEIVASIGRFGPYIKVGKIFVSIKPLDPHDITVDQARKLYVDKLAAEAAKNIADFGKIKVLNGRYGPYVTDGTKNARVPKDTDPVKLTAATAAELLAAAPAKKRYPRRKKR